MSGVNKVLILGRLGKDPESRTIESGSMVVNFSVATSEVYKDKNTGERKENTEWHNIVLWNQPAEIAAKYLHKGDQVFIEGKLKTRSWEKDGVTRYTTEIVGNNITLLGKSDGSAPRSTPQYESVPEAINSNNKKEEAYVDTSELPF